MLAAGHDRGPGALAPPRARLAARPRRDLAVDPAMPQRPLRHVVGRIDTLAQEPEIARGMLLETLLEVRYPRTARPRPFYRPDDL